MLRAFNPLVQQKRFNVSDFRGGEATLLTGDVADRDELVFRRNIVQFRHCWRWWVSGRTGGAITGC